MSSLLAPADAGAPFTAFNFGVELNVPGISTRVCSAAFSECDGLEMTMDVKTIKEGGNNAAVIRVAGTVGFSNLTLRRGLTSTFDLWDWFGATTRDPSLRGDGEVVLFAQDGRTERARFVMQRCLPVKLKAPALNGKDGFVAIEELQLAYESLSLKRPGGANGGGGTGATVGFGLGGGFGG
jgi:phage tail-like protein